MKVIEKISEFFGKYMALIVLAVAALALFVPQSSLWIDTSWINYLLMVVMFGMGLTMKPRDFALVFKRPKDILVGTAAQFIIMPALAFGLSKLFQLDPALTAGVVLVGTCPGGTSSNVITYLSKGDVALSVGMTSVNTLLAPLLTPAITWLLLQTTVRVDVWAMFWSIIQVRNPKDMVKSITILGEGGESRELEMVVGTENFWTVPQAVLQTDNRYRVVVKYRTGTDDEWKIKGSDLAVPEANLYLYEHRE